MLTYTLAKDKEKLLPSITVNENTDISALRSQLKDAEMMQRYTFQGLILMSVSTLGTTATFIVFTYACFTRIRQGELLFRGIGLFLLSCAGAMWYMHVQMFFDYRAFGKIVEFMKEKIRVKKLEMGDDCDGEEEEEEEVDPKKAQNEAYQEEAHLPSMMTMLAYFYLVSNSINAFNAWRRTESGTPKTVEKCREHAWGDCTFGILSVLSVVLCATYLVRRWWVKRLVRRLEAKGELGVFVKPWDKAGVKCS